ncbi:MAG: HAMP domain-containing histidine kinase [Verrucomicrobia bacterium]|nr:HAMP domain-containing histidine kinase [Verrucomicrobiota bacterium]
MKLLNQISYRYAILAAIIFMLAIPTFYYALQQVMLHNLDEYLNHQKEQIKAELKFRPVSSFTSYNSNIVIIDTNATPAPARFYNKDVWVVSDSETITHRALETIENINGKNYYISIQKSLIENEDLTQSIVSLLALLLVLLFTGAVLINRWASKKLWKPFYDTLHQLSAYRINQGLPVRLPATQTNEFNQLNQSVEQLTTNAHNLFVAQKEFTENASHELQTPIAVIQGKTELLMQTNPLTNEQAVLINDVYNTGQHMAKLNRNLLMLSKIENNQYPLTDVVSVNDVVDEMLLVFDGQIHEKGMTITRSFAQQLTITANKTLLNVMIGNLLKNAITHSNANAAIVVSINNNAFSVCNPAYAGSLQTERLFLRFQKQHSNENGTGLGLHLSQKIAELFGAVIHYKFADNQHCFTINFHNAATE